MDLNRAYQRLVELGEDWADKHAAARLLEETRKSVLAECTARIMAKGVSATAAEKSAPAEDDYRAHVAAMVDALKAANIARVRYDSARVHIDMWRTQTATTRTEMNLAGVQR